MNSLSRIHTLSHDIICQSLSYIFRESNYLHNISLCGPNAHMLRRLDHGSSVVSRCFSTQGESSCNHTTMALATHQKRIYSTTSHDSSPTFSKCKHLVLKYIQDNQLEHCLDPHAASRASNLLPHHRREMLRLTGLKASRLSSVLYTLRQATATREAVSPTAKKIIQEYLANNHQMSFRQKQELQSITNLTMRQINQLVHYLKYPQVKITEASKRIVREWCKQHPRHMPSKAQRQVLMQQTGLSYQQLHMQLRTIKKREVCNDSRSQDSLHEDETKMKS